MSVFTGGYTYYPGKHTKAGLMLSSNNVLLVFKRLKIKCSWLIQIMVHSIAMITAAITEKRIVFDSEPGKEEKF